MIYELGHPNTSLPDWQAFRKDLSPFRFAGAIDRSELDLPNHMLPLARGGVIISDSWLLKVRRRRVGFWHRYSGVFELPMDAQVLTGLSVQKHRNLWSIDRWYYTLNLETLVFLFGSTPILTRDVRSAKELALHCWEKGLPNGMLWVRSKPENHEQLVACARQRNMDETARFTRH